MMRDLMRLISLAAAAVGLSGCIDMEKLVHVRADGSGFVEERMLMNRETLAMVRGMAGGVSQPEGAGAFRWLDRDRLAAEAAAMGPGVTLISAEALSTAEGEGYVARYGFTDINQLALNQNPNDQVAGPTGQVGTAPGPASAGPGTGTSPAEKRAAVRFELRPGDQPVLTVRSPEAADAPRADAAVAGEAPDALPDGPEKQMALQMMQKMFKGMHVAVRIEVEGEITDTNARFRDGSRVTLMDIQLDQILADPERLERLAMVQPQGVEQVKALMKDLPGVKVELNDTVEIRFAPEPRNLP